MSTNRLRSVTPHESRPPRFESPNIKRPSLLQRLNSRRRSASLGELSLPSPTLTTTTSTATTSAAAAAVVAESPPPSPFSSIRNVVSISFRGASNRRLEAARNKNMSTVYDPMNPNVMMWLQTSCPQDVLPKILAYTGPQMTATLNKTNRFWHDVVSKESTWRSLCEELYKWKIGDEAPKSWRKFYMYNPCVPVDYKTVASAFTIARGGGGPNADQIRSIRIFLRPGKYVLREALTIQSPSEDITFALETMDLPPTFERPASSDDALEQRNSESSPSGGNRKRSSSATLRSLLCRTVEVDDDDLEDVNSVAESLSSNVLPIAKRAVLSLKTRRSNEPLIRIRQGKCSLKNLELRHYSHGIDIWNGNAALQIQPPLGPDDQPMVVLPVPTAILEQVEVMSSSGRGIVNIDGGNVDIRSCYVHDCAATGIYVGGPGSRANIESTDVVRNGNGNTRARRGIPRGHSGVYLEQGNARIYDCNISNNSLTGISAVSPENAILNLEETDLVQNGTFQLEMPSPGTIARRESSTQNNRLASFGLTRSRSGLVPDDDE